MHTITDGLEQHDARPAPAPLALTMPVRRPVQASLFGGRVALGVTGEASEAIAGPRRLFLVHG